MTQDQPVDYQEKLVAISKKHKVLSYCSFVFGVLVMYRGSVTDENALILGGFLLFLIAYLFREVGVLYFTVGNLLGQVQSLAKKASQGESEA